MIGWDKFNNLTVTLNFCVIFCLYNLPPEKKKTMLEPDNIYLGDCLELLPNIPDKSIDMILTDPPYNLPECSVITRNGGKYGPSKTINTNFKWDNDEINYIWIKECYRILKDFGTLIIFYDKKKLQSIIEYGETLGFYLRDICGWHKTNPVPQVRKVKWASALELFIIMTKSKGKHTFNWELGYKHNIIVSPICMGNERTKHEAQKPVKVFQEIIEYWSNKNNLILDPFLGSGTTAVACIRTNRRYIGIEIDQTYFKIAAKRIALENQQLKLEL